MARLIPLLLLSLLACTALAQQAERNLREGNALYNAGDLPGAVDVYSRAETDERALFNRGNAYYRQDSTAAALHSFEQAASMASTPEAQAKAYHNLGNSHMQQKHFQEAALAYQEALKRVPADSDTRYNLAYAQKMLAAQQQQQQDKDQPQDKDQQKQEPKPQQGQQEKNEQGKGKKDQQPRIDPQDAKRMLDAAQQQEKDVQGKVRKLMQPKPSQPAEKDW
ncbi:MAG: tetratricopeptide repeat protein [Flavobacteriales bacterium]|nr:tetratricopeptide repeat protein [Flavobacteriales bacterium]MBP9080381.1 tetratricopeptide repeat protein [Flavobacteriales bacterium]